MVEIKLTKANQRKIKEYAKAQGISINQAVCNGLMEWWELLGITVGPEEKCGEL
jgi:hypothetical protein